MTPTPAFNGESYFVSDEIPLDLWGHLYEYRILEQGFDIFCLGADGAPGGVGENKDIVFSKIRKR